MHVWFPEGAEPKFRNLRAGWRLAIFAALVASVPGALYVITRLLSAGRAAPTHAAAQAAAASQPLLVGVNEWFLFGWVVLITLIMARLEERPLGDYGLPGREAFGGNFWRGVGWGAVALTVLLLLIALSGDYGFGGLATQGGALARYGAEWAVVFLGVGFFEEFFFRGYLLRTLSGGLGFWPAAILLSLGFGAVHLSNLGEDWMGALSAGLIGLFFCFTWQRTGSLWFAVGLHAAWDYCESFVYGVPDSGLVSQGRLLAPRFHGSHWITGGTVGPEGSVWVLVVVALLFAAFARWRPRQRAMPEAGSSPSLRSDSSSMA